LQEMDPTELSKVIVALEAMVTKTNS